MTASLPHVAHEHREHLLHQIDRMPQTGDMVGTASPAELGLRIDETYVFLTEVLIPHMAAAERALYPELERMLQSVHSMAPLRREHDEVRRSTAELARIREHLGEQRISVGQAIALRRVIFHLYALLKVHLAEEQVYLDILDRREAPEMAEALAAAMAHPGSPEA
jgi:iron-sulfur cluster repair protein YtfE (RIC family)